MHKFKYLIKSTTYIIFPVKSHLTCKPHSLGLPWQKERQQMITNTTELERVRVERC